MANNQAELDEERIYEKARAEFIAAAKKGSISDNNVIIRFLNKNRSKMNRNDIV